MKYRYKPLSRMALPTVILLAVFVASPALHAQTKQLMTWMTDLDYLKGVPNEELMVQKAAVEQIRNSVEFWIKLHPSTKVELKPAPAQPWSVEEIKNQVSLLHQALEAILKEDTSQPFSLGVTEVSVTSEASPLSIVTDSLGRTEIQNRNAVTVATAIDYLPGLALDRSAQRNETGLRLRGFTNKGQVPLYLDGIPIGVPYDGTLDFSRFLSSDVAEIQVAKGFASPLSGPNGLGGSVNIVTRQPEKKFESDALIGTAPGSTLLASLHLGSRWEHFYVQGSVDWYQRDFIPLSGNFPLQKPTGTYPPNRYQTMYERNQSDSRDEKYSGRIAWTPKAQDEYVFSYINQKGEKGNPLYAGPNLSASNRYWRWPYWNKNSYYALTNTGLGESSSIKFRLFYDQFRNALNTYDDATYTTMNNYPSRGLKSGSSYYDDHTGGAATEFTTRIVPRNVFSASFFFKDDTHRENNYYPGRALLSSPLPPGTPTLLDRTQQFSMGFQDVITITEGVRATFGFSADYMKGLRAEQFNSAQTSIIPITCRSNPTNTSLSGCMAHVWTYNPQASFSANLTNLDTFFMTFSDRGRFPLLKESYSYGLGSAIPNPDLEPEHSRNWTFGYSHAFPGKTLMQIDYFLSDLRNAITRAYVTDPGSLCGSNSGAFAGLCSQNANVAREAHQGVEISLRSSPIRRLTMDINYAYLNRTIAYDFSGLQNVNETATRTSVLALSSLPKNKVIANVTVELPRKILAMANYRYEGGIFLQDTTYSPAKPAFGGSYGTVDLGTVAPIYGGLSLQAGVKNLFDRNYYYNSGYPEIGRNWYFNLRYRY
jgi:iron complex outermembrane recepter protein